MRRLIQVVRRPAREEAQPVDHAVIGAVDSNLEFVLLDDAGETAGNMHLIQSQDAAALRLYPVKSWILSAFGHGEDAAGIRFQQYLGRYFDH